MENKASQAGANLLLLNWPQDYTGYLRTNLSALNYQIYEAANELELKQLLNRSQPIALVLFNTNNWPADKWTTFTRLKTQWPGVQVDIFGDDINCWDAFKFILRRAHDCRFVPDSSEKLFDQIQNELCYLTQGEKKSPVLSKVKTTDLHLIASLTEARGDEDTVHHLYRVQLYTKLIALSLAQLPRYRKIITTKYIRHLVQASILHDIGKINIPSGILGRRDKLTSEEQGIIRNHCVFGKKVIEIVRQRIGSRPDWQMAVQIALNHHERYDGSGYPRGLKGSFVPLEARIVALADVYDALTSPRYYRQPLLYTHDQACQILLEEEQDKFDPDILKIFQKNQRKISQIKTQYADVKDIEIEADRAEPHPRDTWTGQLSTDFIDLLAKEPAFLEQANSGIVIEQDGICKFANQVMTELSGYTVKEITRMSFLDIVAPDYRDLLAQRDRLFRAGGEAPVVSEAQIQQADGVIKDVEIFSRIIRYQGKSATLKIVRDITRFKQAEAEIMKLNLAVDQSLDGIAIADLEPKILYANPAYTQMHGYSPEEMIHLPVVELQDRQNEAQMHKYKSAIQQIKTRGSWSGEIGHARKNGTIFPVYMSVTLLKDRAGRPNGILAICRDITEQQEARRRLGESEEKYRILFESSPIAIALADLQENVYAINRSMEELTGYTMEELNALGLFNLCINATERMDLIKNLQTVGKVRDQEVFLKHKDGTSYYVLLNADVIQMGRRKAVMVMARDITQSKKADLEVKKSQERSKELEKGLIQSEKLAALGTFSSGIAHEIKNPLAVILSGTEFLEMKLAGSSPDTQTAIKKIKDSTLRANTIIRNLLRFARPAELDIKKFKPDVLINDTLALLKYRMSLINIAIRVPSAPQDIYVGVDENQIHQVLFNLLMNAIEAMSQGGQITIKTYSTRLPEFLSGQPVCVIEISDTGTGIAQADLDRIFKPFFTTKKRDKGTGLGLTICKAIIDNHKGKLVIESQPGQGTTAKVILPLLESLSKGRT